MRPVTFIIDDLGNAEVKVGDRVALVITAQGRRQHDIDESAEAMRRLAGCWRACEGIPTEALESEMLSAIDSENPQQVAQALVIAALKLRQDADELLSMLGRTATALAQRRHLTDDHLNNLALLAHALTNKSSGQGGNGGGNGHGGTA